MLPAVLSARRLPLLVVGLAAAWAIPVALHLLRIDALVWPIALLALASVLTAGAELLDRLVLAGLALAGGELVLGLGFSVWPWGLQPLPVGGVTLTAVVCAGWLRRRRPTLPLRVRWSDLIVLGTVAVAAVAAYRPVMARHGLARLEVSTTSLDRFAHFALFQTIQRVGGYAFLHQTAASQSVEKPTQVVYPEAWHYLAALGWNFLRSGRGAVDQLTAYDQYFLGVIAAYCVLCGLVVWAARWALGRTVSEFARVIACVLVAVFLLYSPLVRLIPAAYDSQTAGALFLVLAAAVLIRSVANEREQIVLLGAGIVAATYAYTIYGGILILAVAVRLACQPSLVRRRWRVLLGVLVPACVIAVYPTGLAVLQGFDVNSQALSPGSAVRVSPALTVCLTAVALVAAWWRRGPAELRPGLSAVLGASAVATGAFGLYQLHAQGRTSYYYDKFLLAWLLVAVICAAAALTAVARTPAPAGGGGRTWRGQLVLARLAAAAVVLVSAGFAVGQPRLDELRRGEFSLSAIPLVGWARSHSLSSMAPTLAALARNGLLVSGEPMLLADDHSTNFGWHISFASASLNRQLGTMQAALADVFNRRPLHGSAHTKRLFRQLVQAVEQTPVPLRIVFDNASVATAFRSELAAHPNLHAEVLARPKLRPLRTAHRVTPRTTNRHNVTR